MLDHENAARGRRWQRHDQRPDHGVGLLRVLVRGEELAWCIDQHRVEFGSQLASLRQAEFGAQAVEDRSQRSVPLSFVDLYAALRDLPRVADIRVQQRLLALAEPGRSTYQAQLLRLSDGDGQGDRADAPHLQPQVIGARGASCTKRARSHGLAQKTRKPVTREGRRRRHSGTVVTPAHRARVGAIRRIAVSRTTNGAVPRAPTSQSVR
jgi:hypothetical protein